MEKPQLPSYLEDALAMLHGQPMVAYEPGARQIVQTDSGDLVEGESQGWLKFSFAFRESMLAQLAGAALGVFVCISLHVNKAGTSWPSIETIMKETGYGRNKVLEAIAVLEAIPGLMDITRQRGSKNIYRPAFVAYGKRSPNGGTTSKSSPVSEQRGPLFQKSDPPAGGYEEEEEEEGRYIGAKAPSKPTGPAKWESSSFSSMTLPPQPNTQDDEPVAPIELEVPQGGNKTSRAAYLGSCPECHCKVIAQTMDFCPGRNCGIPVVWKGSSVADARYKTAAHAKTDAEAKQRRDRRPLSPFTGWVLEQARHNAAAPADVKFIKDEEARLLVYERQVGIPALEAKVLSIMQSDNPSVGRGLILHLLRSVAFMASTEVTEPTEEEVRATE